MDKRELKDKIKMLIKLYILLAIVVMLPISIIISLLEMDSNEEFLNTFINNISIMFVALTILIALICFMNILADMLYKVRRKNEIIKNKNYKRDIPNVPPAIASMLLDNSVEITTDYTATIANLVVKGFLDINYETGEVKLLNDKISSLMEHEQYALRCVLKEKVYNGDKFKELIINDSKKEGFVEEGQQKVHFLRNFLIAIILFIIFAILYNKYEYYEIIGNILAVIGLLSIFNIFGVIAYSIFMANKFMTESYIRTEKGRKMAIEFSKVKNFIHDFSLLSDKSLTDIVLWDEYIPYAISLNEADAIEKYIDTNSKYRKIIYGEKNK